MAQVRVALIRFSGPPANLVASLALPREANLTPRLIVNGGALPLRIAGDAGTITGLAFSLPDATPPGEIKGEVVAGDTRFAALIDVQARTRLRVEPTAIDLHAAGSDKVTATLNVANYGNCALEWQVDQTVTLRPAGTLARSVKSAFRQTELDIADRVIALGEEVARAPSHELTVIGRMVPTALAMGAKATVTLEFDLSAGVEPDTTWTGSLRLMGERIRISVQALPPR